MKLVTVTVTHQPTNTCVGMETCEACAKVHSLGKLFQCWIRIVQIVKTIIKHFFSPSSSPPVADANQSKQPRRGLWLRNSMRKTKLIPLPNQVERNNNNNNNPHRSHEGAGPSSVVTYAPPETSQSLVLISPPTNIGQVEQESTMDSVGDFMSFNRITFDPPAPHPPNRIIEDRQRSGAQDTVDEFVFVNEVHPPSAPVLDQRLPQSPPVTLPRQLGRRSELSPRIVAINAESNTIIISHGDNSGNRPTSAPARVGLVQRTEQHPEERRNIREREVFDSMSSVASSRNPSPVSLVSSSGSSVTSARNSAPER